MPEAVQDLALLNHFFHRALLLGSQICQVHNKKKSDSSRHICITFIRIALTFDVEATTKSCFANHVAYLSSFLESLAAAASFLGLFERERLGLFRRRRGGLGDRRRRRGLGERRRRGERRRGERLRLRLRLRRRRRP